MSWAGRKLGDGDRYEIERLLGTGAMGIVFLATDTRLRRQVVLKLLAAHLAINPRVRERFRREAHIQANLIHQNIVRAIDVVEDDENFAIAMDYVDGPDLATYIQNAGGRLSLDVARDLFDPILDALQQAHEHGVVHRDLKPENILIDQSGSKPVPKITDFGVAKILGDEVEGMTRQGALLGTPSFMPPEQLKGSLDIDQRVDIYALGAVLYQMLSGQLPYDETSEYEITHRVLSGKRPTRLRAVVPEIPKLVEQVIDRAMAFETSDRFETAAAFRAAMKAAFTGGGLTVEAHHPSKRVEPALPKVASAASKASTETTAPARDTRRASVTIPEESSQLERRQAQRKAIVVANIVVLLLIALIVVLVSSDSLDGNTEQGDGFARDVEPSFDSGQVQSFDATIVEPPLAFGSELWREGNVWVYRVERTQIPGIVDEAGPLEFYIRRRIESVQDDQTETRVELIDDGGLHPPRTHNITLSAHCLIDTYERNPNLGLCLPAHQSELTPHRLHGGDFQVVETQSSRTDLMFDPEIGWLTANWLDDNGRYWREELVAYRVGNQTSGDPGFIPPTCDWDDKTDDSGSLSLSGLHGAHELYIEESPDTTFFQLPGVITYPFFDGWTEHMAFYKAKAWAAPDNSAEYVALIFREDGSTRVVILRIASRQVSYYDFDFDVPDTEPTTLISAYLIAELTGCIIQIRQTRSGEESRVRHYRINPGGLEFIGGSLRSSADE